MNRRVLEIKKFNLVEWIDLIETSYETIKGVIKDLYSLKNQLDSELSELYVEKITDFYSQFLRMWNEYSLESPESVNQMTVRFEVDIKKLMENYSNLLFFQTIAKDFTGNEFEYPKCIEGEVWMILKEKYLRDFHSVDDEEIEIIYQGT
ncbi:hypothetical protein [Paenibacillus glucanolyticus]|uniref:hypothetical protein n=1 Tax=Paenibacillus glucanolyticus TaxID=59843 RepID=UPI00096DAD3D|nr:hypothetical protein [Paenibacillus glucanolyticus]OMF76782.1 hypothetical protein BK142_14785 [Paenibacillus glucanolyticus]